MFWWLDVASLDNVVKLRPPMTFTRQHADLLVDVLDRVLDKGLVIAGDIRVSLAEVERRLIPDLSDRIVTKFHYAPPDFTRDLNAHVGSAFSLEPVLWQSAWFRAHNRDDVISNLSS